MTFFTSNKRYFLNDWLHVSKTYNLVKKNVICVFVYVFVDDVYHIEIEKDKKNL